MSGFDTIVRGGTVRTPEGALAADLALAGGRIAAILPRGEGLTGEEIDAAGLEILPGAIDIHFHVRAPAYPERGTVASETRASAAGGITTLFEMPITDPCCNSAARVRARAEHFSEHAFVNFGLFAAPGEADEPEYDALREAGAIALKIFTTPAPAGREEEFSGLALPGAADQLRVLQAARRAGFVVVAHCEDAELLAEAHERARALDPADSATHLAARPALCEALAVAKLLTLNVEAQAKLHIAHVTSARTVDILRRFRGSSDFSAETCPHYLFRTAADVARAGVYAKINPPVRSAVDREALWDALRDGTIEHVTTDHASFSHAEKAAFAGDFLHAPPGTPGSEILVPSMLDAVAAGRLDLDHAVRLLAGNAADRFGLSAKGRIVPGADADLVLVDRKGVTAIRAAELHTAARDVAHLYDGARFEGRVRRTILGGRTVFDGAIVGSRGFGRLVSPDSAPARHPTGENA